MTLLVTPSVDCEQRQASNDLLTMAPHLSCTQNTAPSMHQGSENPAYLQVGQQSRRHKLRVYRAGIPF